MNIRLLVHRFKVLTKAFQQAYVDMEVKVITFRSRGGGETSSPNELNNFQKVKIDYYYKFYGWNKVA